MRAVVVVAEEVVVVVADRSYRLRSISMTPPAWPGGVSMSDTL